MECNKARSAFVNGMSAALSVVGFGRASPEELGFDPKVLEKHKQRIKTHQENGVFTGFAEGALSDGKIVFLNLCGFTDKTKKHRMTERTLFRGYSMMKPITATAFMSLVDDGMLKLDDPVHKFIPKFKFLRVKRGKKTEPLRKTMTLRHLLMHTSGIGYGPGAITPGVPLVARSPEEKLYKAVAVKQETGEVDSLEKLCEELCSLPLLFQPGADYTYGMSLDVLGYVMQLVTGQPLRKIIQTRVLEPVGMRDSCFLVPQSKLHQLSTYYRLMRDPVKGNRWLERLDGLKAKDSMYAKGSQAVYRSGGLPAGVPAAGGLWGAGRSTMLFSLRDILLYCQMLLNGGQSLAGHRVLKASTASSLQMDWLRLKEACRTRNPPGWGSPDVGWSPLGNVERYGPHAGALYMGGMSYFWLDPRRKVAAAIMTESYWQVNPLGWKADLDDLEQVIQSAMKGTSSKRQAESQDGSLAKRLKC